MGYRPFKSRCEVCGKEGRVITCPHCGRRACGNCINKTALIGKKCPNCGKKL